MSGSTTFDGGRAKVAAATILMFVVAGLVLIACVPNRAYRTMVGECPVSDCRTGSLERCRTKTSPVSGSQEQDTICLIICLSQPWAPVQTTTSDVVLSQESVQFFRAHAFDTLLSLRSYLRSFGSQFGYALRAYC
jgi:hypothetical protein